VLFFCMCYVIPLQFFFFPYRAEIMRILLSNLRISVTVKFIAEECGRPQKPQPSINLSVRHNENLLFPKIVFYVWCVFFNGIITVPYIIN
jgi:hypothetical protein